MQIALSASDDANGIDPVDPGTMGLGPGSGMHGGLHWAEMRCLCVGHGAGFKAGTASALPSSTQDIAPTVFQLLGLAPNGNGFEGRVLTEILAASGDRANPDTPSKAHTLDLAGRNITLRQRFVDGHAYLDMTSGS